MGGVRKSVRRKDPRRDDGPSQRFRVFCDFQSGEAADDRQAFLNLGRVAERGLVDDDLGNRALKLAPSIRPPFLRT